MSLPVKSTSRRIQKQHIRVVDTVRGKKSVLVNKGVDRKVLGSNTRYVPRKTLGSVVDQNSSGQIVESKGQVVLRPKKRTITSKEELWQRLSGDPELRPFINSLNINQDIAIEEMFDWFESLKNGQELLSSHYTEPLLTNVDEEQPKLQNPSDEEVIDVIKDHIEAGNWGFRHDGLDVVRVTNWGNIPGIPREATISTTQDPLNGKVFKKDSIFEPIDDFVSEDLEGSGVFAEDVMFDPINDWKMMHDHFFIKYLKDKKVPFLHVGRTPYYRMSYPDFVLVPKKYAAALKNAAEFAAKKTDDLETKLK